MENHGELHESLADSLKDCTDRGAAKLAEKYAKLIDEAAAVQRIAKHLAALKRAVRMYDMKEADDALEYIEGFVAEHSVMSDLGPKLLATLTALGLTPAGRGVRTLSGVPERKPAATDVVNELQLAAEKRRQKAAGIA